MAKMKKFMVSIKVQEICESNYQGSWIKLVKDHSLTELDRDSMEALAKYLRLSTLHPDGDEQWVDQHNHAEIVDFIGNAVYGKLEKLEIQRAEEKRKAMPKGETIFLRTVVDRNRPDKEEI